MALGMAAGAGGSIQQDGTSQFEGISSEHPSPAIF